MTFNTKHKYTFIYTLGSEDPQLDIRARIDFPKGFIRPTGWICEITKEGINFGLAVLFLRFHHQFYKWGLLNENIFRRYCTRRSWNNLKLQAKLGLTPISLCVCVCVFSCLLRNLNVKLKLGTTEKWKSSMLGPQTDCNSVLCLHLDHNVKVMVQGCLEVYTLITEPINGRAARGKLLKHWALTLYNSWRKSQCQRHLCCKSVRCPVSSVMSNRNVIIRPNWMLVTDAVCEASYWTRYHMLLYSHFTVSFSCKSPWDLFGVNCTIWKCPNVWEVLKNC